MQKCTTIAIIGATGIMGTAISRALSKRYHLILFANDHKRTLSLAEELNSTGKGVNTEAIACTKDAGWEADIIIMAVPYHAEPEIAAKIRDVANQKIVVSIANPLNDTYTGLVTAPDSSAAEELQKKLPGSHVVKAFNTTFAADFEEPVIDGKLVDAFIAGDNDSAVETVAELVEAAGFNPMIAGKLSVSRTLENMQLLLIRLNMKYNYNWRAGWKILH